MGPEGKRGGGSKASTHHTYSYTNTSFHARPGAYACMHTHMHAHGPTQTHTLTHFFSLPQGGRISLPREGVLASRLPLTFFLDRSIIEVGCARAWFCQRYTDGAAALARGVGEGEGKGTCLMGKGKDGRKGKGRRGKEGGGPIWMVGLCCDCAMLCMRAHG